MKPDFENIRNIIEERLGTYFNSVENEYMIRFSEIANYSLLSGGKRLRPILLYKTSEIFGGSSEDALTLGCALEMIHTYSLIHDDLPAMDDDRYRRGKLTSHVKYGEDMAILAGDALLNRAYELMFDRLLLTENPKRMIKSCQLIAESAGYLGMIGGQVVDVKTEKQEIDQLTLDFIITNKTAKLLIAAMVAGAMLGEIDDQELESFRKAAYHIGYSFQLIDDYLDVVGDSEVIGKETGRDQELGKNTYVKYNGVEQTLEDAIYHLNKSKNLLHQLENVDLGFIYDIIEFLKHREK